MTAPTGSFERFMDEMRVLASTPPTPWMLAQAETCRQIVAAAWPAVRPRLPEPPTQPEN